MRTFSQNESLTDAQFGRLADFLGNCKGGNGMKVEQLDGFFAALVAGPGTVMPSEYYPEVFGGEMSDTCEFGTLDEANEILGLIMLKSGVNFVIFVQKWPETDISSTIYAAVDRFS